MWGGPPKQNGCRRGRKIFFGRSSRKGDDRPHRQLGQTRKVSEYLRDGRAFGKARQHGANGNTGAFQDCLTPAEIHPPLKERSVSGRNESILSDSAVGATAVRRRFVYLKPNDHRSYYLRT